MGRAASALSYESKWWSMGLLIPIVHALRIDPHGTGYPSRIGRSTDSPIVYEHPPHPGSFQQDGGPNPVSPSGILPPFFRPGMASGSIRGAPGSTRQDRPFKRCQSTRWTASRHFLRLPSIPLRVTLSIRIVFSRTKGQKDDRLRMRRGSSPGTPSSRVPIFSIVRGF